MTIHKQENIATLTAQLSGSNILLKWKWINNTVSDFVKKTLVFYIKEGDSSVYVLQHSENRLVTEYTMVNVSQNINYNICIRPLMTSNWPGVRDPKICTNISQNQWELSSFVGSVVSALLALFLIILLVIMSKRVKDGQNIYKSNTDKNAQRKRYDSAFDSVVNKEENSFYDDLATSDVSYLDGSYRLSGDTSISSSTSPSVVVAGEETSNKTFKKRSSLIEEETVTPLPLCDGLIRTVTLEDDCGVYHGPNPCKGNRKSPSHSLTESKNRIMETCLDDLDSFKMPRQDEIRPKSLSPKIRISRCQPKDSTKNCKFPVEM